MKLTLCFVLFLAFLGRLPAQYEEGSFGTTGSSSIENKVKEGNLVLVGRFDDNAGVSMGAMGVVWFRARVTVTQILLGACAPVLDARYRVFGKSAKGPDGLYHVTAGLHDPPANGTELIAIGKLASFQRNNQTEHQFQIQRYLYVTPENIERVTKAIIKYHGTQSAAKAQSPKSANQALVPSIASSAKTVHQDQPLGAFNQRLWWGGIVLVLIGLILFWAKWRK